ncbi:putative membrane protein [Actinoplanes octamycinicus]|uniref:Putative membrane protein n=1 Tax=Actinoplanes octamycinicus TaxID=135948 RepID=A0A7W7H2F6_9ACTN|nr:hypothetical protein [Actinoplanes octamycinicus]MBB4742761.1 putative membrane protein [Actinoplanes octamycinicus]GIE58384.1 hypothetical protein Aoc01nite_37860 [Actinoplanes octamycinicus]
MLYLVLFTLILLTTAVFAAWPAFHAATPGGATTSVDGDRSPARATTLEGALTAQLVRGEINREQYQRALERLAARDEAEHPLSVPEKGDSSAGA